MNRIYGCIIKIFGIGALLLTALLAVFNRGKRSERKHQQAKDMENALDILNKEVTELSDGEREQRGWKRD